MAWYETGTVNVTLNNAAVTGVGTQWVAGARQGEAFVGPDGRLYEVMNIASNTSLTLTQPYRGTTQAAQPYALAPFQGYVKELADLAAELLRRYRDALVLAEGAIQKTSIGSKYGALTNQIVPGFAYGQGGDPDAYPHVSINAPAPPGVYFCSPDNTDTPGTFGVLIREGRMIDPTVGTWLLDRFNSTNGQQYWRTKTNLESWSAWVQTLTVNNAYGLLGLKSAAFADLSGDVGAGAAMQSGSNINGDWFRFQNGLQICYGRKSFPGNTWKPASSYQQFPIAFKGGSIPNLQYTTGSDGSGYTSVVQIAEGLTNLNYRIRQSTGAADGGTSVDLMFLATGVWK